MPSPQYAVVPNADEQSVKIESPNLDSKVNVQPSVSHSPLPLGPAVSFGGISLTTAELTNFFYMALNVGSSVGIVMANKWAIETYHFKFGTLLTFIHFIVTFLGLEVCARVGMFERKALPIKGVLGLCGAFCGFVVLTNLSLQYNSVGFYQMAKVLTTPCIVLIQIFFYKVEFSTPIKLALTVTCLGVGIASVTDVQLNLIGCMYAVAGVVVTSLYQIWVGTKQKELEANSMQLLYYQAPISAAMLLFVIPIMDDMAALRRYDFSIESMFWVFFSAFLAFFVNISIFLVIGKTSPVTYNMVGHFKLCLIVILGFIIFNYKVDYKNISGILVTLGGIFWYTHLNLKNKK